MELRRVGELEVSVIGLGCSNLGRELDKTRSVELVQSALDQGVNFFDTANVYNGTRSEQFLGRALKGRRDEAVVATKFGRVANSDNSPGAARWLVDATRKSVLKAIDESLTRLGIDCIDLYILHLPDLNTPVAETLGALNELIIAGKVREIGCSEVDLAYVRDAARAAEENGLRPFVNVQNRYNLLDRERADQHGVKEECARSGMAFVPYAPLASGMLSGKYRRGESPSLGTRLAGQPVAGYSAENLLTQRNFDVVEALTAFADSHGHTMLELAFAGLLARPEFASIIAGASSPAQIKANADAASWVLSVSEFEEVKRLSESATS